VANTFEERSLVEGTEVRRVFRPTPRLSSYLLFLALGPYAMVEDQQARIPSRLFARQSMARYLDPDEIFELTRAGLEFYEDYYGVPYPFEKYDQLFVPEFNPGGMENPAAVTFHEMALFRHEPSERERGRRADVILHEMAHMWFGDLVTMRWWDGLWLNESFATFMAAHAQAKATRFDDAWEEFLTADKAWALWQDQLPTTHPIAGAAPDTDMAFANFDGITYGKGASVLKQLARFVGEENFRCGVQSYMRKYAWGNTDLPDFFAELGEAAGMDLSEWSRLHIETAGVNTLQPHLEVADGKIRLLELEQLEGNGDRVLRPQRLEVALYPATADGSLGQPHVLPVSVSGARTAVEAAAGLPVPAFIWANHDDHAYLRVLLDPASLDFVRQNLERLPHSRTRRAVWLTLWEMVREGRLAPAAYLDTFLVKSPLEPNAKVQQGQFRNALTAVNHYLFEAAREAYQGRLNALAWRQAEAAAPGSDAQKEWLDLAIDTSAEEGGLGRLAGLLDGAGSLTGLEMHPERRWNVVVRLCAYGHPGASDRVANELLLDGTDLGRRQALRAETSLPDLARKEALWKRCLEDRRTSGSDLRVGLSGLHWSHQEQLSRQFVERYFTAIQEVRATRDQEFANAFAELCFPANVHEFDVVRKLNAYIGAHPDLPGDLRKILLNLTDEMLRCLRLRAQWR
jgi:aminopeptidase N